MGNTIGQELVVAARENNVLEVRRLMSVGAEVDAKGNDGWTPLHEASGEGHVQVVKELLEHGADTEAKEDNGPTPLHSACCNGHLAVVIELRKHGADIEATTNSGSTPLHRACCFGRVAVVTELIGPGGDIDANNDSSNGTTTDANNDSSSGATTTILGKRKRSRGGANIEAKTNQGDTPLHIASWKGHLAVVKALLSGGAKIPTANNFYKLPIHQAVFRGNSEVIKYLFQQLYARIRRLPLHKLLEDLTWIGDPDSTSAPPLRVVLHRNVLGSDDVVEFLEHLVAQNPALLSSCDQDGSLPLHVACRRGASFTVVQSLVNLYKASVKSVTVQGDLPIFLACEIPEPSLDTIFLLMQLYPELVCCLPVVDRQDD
jgi:ankyrin repeat protein